jgi:hypothetical protein
MNKYTIYKKKFFYTLNFIFIFIFILVCSVIFEYYLKITYYKARNEAHKNETVRKQQIDRSLYQDAINEGYEEIIFPYLYEENYSLLKKKINLDIIPVNSLPYKNNYYCNEGYGLIKYTSDRFGFRNNDDIWKVDNINKKILLVGDSFAHGACVNTEHTIATLIQKNKDQEKRGGDLNNKTVFNVSLSGNNPFIYASLLHLFSPIVKPNYIVVVFYANDNDYSSKSIFQKNLKKDLHMDYFSNNYLSQEIKNKIEYSQIYLKKIILEKNKNQETNFFKKLTNLLKFSKTRELIIFVYKKFFFNTIPFSSRLTIDKAIENCKIYNCKPIIVYIPNSKYWRPDVTADLFADSLKFYTIHNNINFIDMREDFYNFDENEFYAQSGPHLSPVGYKLVANKINQVIK